MSRPYSPEYWYMYDWELAEGEYERRARVKARYRITRITAALAGLTLLGVALAILIVERLHR